MATVYISPTGGTVTQDGTTADTAYAYSSLSTAETDAGSGGTIYFLDGTYSIGNSSWDGSGITYKSLNPKGAIIVGNNGSNLQVLTFGSGSSTDILISDFHFKNLGFTINGTGTAVTISGIILEHTNAYTRNYYGTFWGQGKRFDVLNSSFKIKYSSGDSLIYNGNSSSEVTNCTFYIDATGLAANSIRNYDSYARPQYKNCIFVSNNSAAIQSTTGLSVITNSGCTNCCIHDFGTSHTITSPNISDDPQFVDAPSDLRLRPSSPCIGAATTS